MKSFCGIIIVLFFSTCYADNVESLDPHEERLSAKLERLQWCDSLQAGEIDVISNLIASSKHALSESALCVAVVQDIPNLQCVMRIGVDRGTFYTRVLSKAVFDGIQNGESPIRALSRINVLAVNSANVDSVARKKAGHVAAVFAARKIRSGSAFINGLEDFTMTDFDRKLIQYSKIPTAQAVDLIVGKIAEAKIADSDSYDLVRVLASYSRTVRAKLLIDACLCSETKEAGKILILRAMEGLVSSFSSEDLRLTKEFLREINTGDTRLRNVVEQTLNVVQSEISFRNVSLTMSLGL